MRITFAFTIFAIGAYFIFMWQGGVAYKTCDSGCLAAIGLFLMAWSPLYLWLSGE